MEPITLSSSLQSPHVITQRICLIYFIILLLSTPYSDSLHVDITKQNVSEFLIFPFPSPVLQWLGLSNDPV